MEGEVMGRLTLIALRVVLAGLLAGSVFVQTVMVALLANDLNGLNEEYAYLRNPILILVVLGILSIQVILVCVWKLSSMVRRGTVFSHAAFRYVHVIIGAVVAAAMVLFGFGFLLAPGEAVAPGVVMLIGGAGVGVLGVALVVVVLRMLLAQAVARDVEATELQAELAQVI
jgi:hypothetical protein